MAKIDLNSVARAAAEVQRRRMDALELYRLTDIQEKVLNDSADVRTFLLKGGNRSAKSHTAAMRFASIVRDKPLHTMSGKTIECRAEHQKDRPLLTWVVGLQLDHIGQTMHRLLFRPGLFDIVRDPKTGIWRAWHPPMFPGDFDIPKSQRKASPPLIPPSEIAEWSWEKKSEHQFSMCRLNNGTEIYAFASSAPVKAGDPVDEIWIDEEIKFAAHYSEWQARLPDRDGRLFWSSWPAHANSALLNLNKQCDREAKEFAKGTRDRVTARKATLRFSDNPFFTRKQIEDTLAQWPTEAERRARDLGEFTTDLIKFYHQYDEEIHRVDYESPEMDDKISAILRANNWTPPAEWTRDLILDPGTAHPAVLMIAIPPRHLWDDGEPYYIPYREVYESRMNAEDIARAVKRTEQGFMFERFYIDGQAARQTPMGFSGTIGSNYTAAFARMNLSSAQMPGSGFMPGDPDPVARSLVVRELMRIRPSGKPQLRIVNRNCPGLVEQLRDTVRHIVHDETKEVPAPGQAIDVMSCLEYHASRRPGYVFPKAPAPMKSPADLALDLELRLFGKKSEEASTVYCGVKY